MKVNILGMKKDRSFFYKKNCGFSFNSLVAGFFLYKTTQQ